MLKSRKFWLGIVFSAGFLALFFWQIDLGRTADALKRANYWWLLPAVAVYFAAVYFRALRWHFLLLPLKSVPGRRLYPIVIIGYMANNLLPVRLGEFVRAFFVGQKEGVSASGALATILVERVVDGVFLLVLALAVWPFLPVTDVLRDLADKVGVSQNALVLLISAPFIIALVLFFAVAFSPRLGRRLVRLILLFIPSRLKPPAARLILGFLGGLASLRNPRRVLATIFLTVPIWMTEALMFLFIAQAFGLHTPFHGLLLTMSTSNIATSLPSSGGGVGLFEYGTRVTMEALGASAEVAVAFAIVLHVALLAPVTVLGLLFLWLENISLGEVARRQVYKPKPAGEAQR